MTLTLLIFQTNIFQILLHQQHVQKHTSSCLVKSLNSQPARGRYCDEENNQWHICVTNEYISETYLVIMREQYLSV